MNVEQKNQTIKPIMLQQQKTKNKELKHLKLNQNYVTPCVAIVVFICENCVQKK